MPSEQNGSGQMQRLSGLDTMFLAIDTSTTSGLVGTLFVFDRSGAPDGANRAAIRERLLDRLDAIPPLRWRLREVPPRSGLQYWDDDPDFGIDNHLHDRVVAPPGTQRQLTAEVARLMALPLAPDRPPWDLSVIEGLEGGNVAHLLRIHHALIDGGLMADVTAMLADGWKRPPSLGKPSGASSRARPDALTQTLASAVAVPVRAVGLQTELVAWLGKRAVRDGIRTVPDMVTRGLRGAIGIPGRAAAGLRPADGGGGGGGGGLPSIVAPKTMLTGALTDRREYAFTVMSLPEVKRIGKATGSTVNDVVMSLGAAAVRRYLKELGKLPGKPLTAVVATSTRTGNERPKWTNHVWMMLAGFPTDVEDPVQRLKAARAAMKKAKATSNALPIGLIQSASFFWPSALMAAGAKFMARPAVAKRIPVTPWNLTMSNVRGLSKPISIDGVLAVGNYPVTFLPPSTGLGIVVVSYGDDLECGLATCPDLVPDVERISGYLTDALAELSRAVGK
jgi:diacylglycerol O-acyltransferase / wax synthase